MSIKNSVSNDFLSTFVDSINIFDCHLTGVKLFSAYCALIRAKVLMEFNNFSN